MTQNSIQDQINILITRGVEQSLPAGALEQALRSASQQGQKLRIKHGIDPTGPRIHIGRAVLLWKLREFQQLGHQIVLIVGDFTGMIGDASDKQAMRQPLTREQVEANMRDYAAQFGKILDMSKVELRFNSEWLDKLGFKDVLELAQLFTVAQMIERENFSQRYQDNKPIGLHEFLYPLMQGYDSFAIDADVEIGGSDQLFNMMAGRKVQEKYGKRPQLVLTTKILNGLDGRKMSTSWGNCVYVLDSPQEQFGKIMSMGDETMFEYFELATDVPAEEIDQLKQQIAQGANPKQIKLRLASEIVKRYHGEEAAQAAQLEFESVFARGGVPEDVELVQLSSDSLSIVDVLEKTNVVKSRGEAKRLIEQGGVTLGDAVISDAGYIVQLSDTKILLRVGKRRFVYISK